MISVIGAAMWDVILGVDALPELGELRQGSPLSETPGGAAINSAAWAARAGAHVHVFTRVPSTNRGAAFVSACEDLRSCGDGHLTVQRLPAKGEMPTCYVLCTPDGERSMLWVPGAPDSSLAGTSTEFTAEHDTVLARSAVTWIQVDDEQRRARYHQRAGGLRGLPVWHLQQEQDSDRRWELVVGSIDDAPLPERDTLRSLGCRLAVMTEGAQGAHVCFGAGPWTHVPAQLAGTLVDTIGAGDAFLGGLLHALDTPQPLSEKAARHAVAAGTCAGREAVGQRGGWPAL